jgi:hypothetical protein
MENRQFYQFIIITIILPLPHDSEICPDDTPRELRRCYRPRKLWHAMRAFLALGATTATMATDTIIA